jgi:hypothetical protein
MSLTSLAEKHNTDKGIKSGYKISHGYTVYYENLFDPIRNDNINFLEIGVVMEGTPGGQSLRMWTEYFTAASIYAFDIVPINQFKTDRVRVFQGDGGNRDDLQNMINEFNVKFDIIIEDGSHTAKHQQVPFGFLFKHINSGGIYIIEDILIPFAESKYDEWGRIANQSTYYMLKSIIDDKTAVSEYILDEEKKYLKNNIKSVKLIDDLPGIFCAAIITKL